MDPHLLQTWEQGLKAAVRFMANVILVWKNSKPGPPISHLNKLNPCTPLAPKTPIANLILININFLLELRVWQVGGMVSNNPHIWEIIKNQEGRFLRPAQKWHLYLYAFLQITEHFYK